MSAFAHGPRVIPVISIYAIGNDAVGESGESAEGAA